MCPTSSSASPGAPSRKLTFHDAIDIWAMHRQGWIQSRIAAKFDVNQGRISEVLSGKSHLGSENYGSECSK